MGIILFQYSDGTHCPHQPVQRRGVDVQLARLTRRGSGAAGKCVHHAERYARIENLAAPSAENQLDRLSRSFVHFTLRCRQPEDKQAMKARNEGPGMERRNIDEIDVLAHRTKWRR